MADVSEAARVKAEKLFGVTAGSSRLLSQVAAYIQQMSDAAKRVAVEVGHEASEPLAPFILPEPVDPLAAALKEANEGGGYTYQDWANALPDALAKRGLKIVSTDA